MKLERELVYSQNACSNKQGGFDKIQMTKDELRETVLLKESNRLGDFAENNFYLVSTLLDPRSLLNLSGFCQKKI